MVGKLHPNYISLIHETENTVMFMGLRPQGPDPYWGFAP